MGLSLRGLTQGPRWVAINLRARKGYNQILVCIYRHDTFLAPTELKFAIFSSILEAMFMLLGEKTISWAEVFKIHRTQTAVQFQNKKVASIICAPEQNKLVNEQQIIYTIPNKKQYSKLIDQMKPCIGGNDSVVFFIKKEKNVWINAGLYKLNSCSENDACTDFCFEKC